MQEVPSKPRRKTKLEVPVHEYHSTKNHEIPHTHKTFSDNFNGKRNKERESLESRISRRHLLRENERLQAENQKLASVQEHLNKKNCKLKERLGEVLTANGELSGENTTIRKQYQDLVNQYNDLMTEYEKPRICQNCNELTDHLDKCKRDYSALRKINHEMQEDCAMLKNVIYRLNVQLEKYQQKLHAHKIPLGKRDVHKDDQMQTISAENLGLGESHYDHPHTPVSWGKVNAHTLGPLLNAYQETIAEKDAIIESYEGELAHFMGRLKDIIKENENLHIRLTEDAECSKVLSTHIDNIKVDLKTTKDQNDLLIKKCALKQDKIEEILKCYEQKVEMLKRDYTVLHDTYLKTKSEAVTMREKNKALVDAQDDFKNERNQYIPISVHNSSVNECKKWYEELKLQYENEKLKLAENIVQFKSQIEELNSKINALNTEKSDLEAKLKNYDKHIKKAEGRYLELEHSLHEVQLSRSACRKQLHKAMSFAKDLVNEQESLLKALNQRQQENKAVKRMGTDIASRMDILRNQLKCVQKEAWQELSTVEERIQEQDSLITSMKEEHEQEVERLKRIIKDKEHKPVNEG